MDAGGLRRLWRRGKIKKTRRIAPTSFFSAQDKTRTCTNVIVHYPLKVACLPISPPGRHCRISHFGCANIEFIFESAKFSGDLCRKNDFFLPSVRRLGSREVGGRLPPGGLGRLWRPEKGCGGAKGDAAAGRREPGFRKALLQPGPSDGAVGRRCRAVLPGGAAGPLPDR